MGWKIVWEYTQEDLQNGIDDGPKAKLNVSDAFQTYASLWIHFGRYEASQGKPETCSVEVDHAELRGFLASIAKLSRCFSRCPYALYCAVRLFVYCYNHRQLNSRQHLRYTSRLIDFVDPLI